MARGRLQEAAGGGPAKGLARGRGTGITQISLELDGAYSRRQMDLSKLAERTDTGRGGEPSHNEQPGISEFSDGISCKRGIVHGVQIVAGCRSSRGS